MNKITLSADENLLAAAHRRAAAERTTLNAQFRRWLSDYVNREQQAAEAAAVMRELQGKLRTGHKLSRDEMNDR
ncbi:MAG: hypothetical protein JKY89_10640 [Immundisolibacteraceae bacterium]|nr:hypothetical protein [Immundisolibacteraceae bacterium]